MLVMLARCLEYFLLAEKYVTWHNSFLFPQLSSSCTTKQLPMTLSDDACSQLAAVALRLAAHGRGLLAADESTSTIGKRFEKAGLSNVEVGKNCTGAHSRSNPLRQNAYNPLVCLHPSVCTQASLLQLLYPPEPESVHTALLTHNAVSQGNSQFCSQEERRAYRELYMTAPGIGQYISGVIMFKETLYQKTAGEREREKANAHVCVCVCVCV